MAAWLLYILIIREIIQEILKTKDLFQGALLSPSWTEKLDIFKWQLL